MTSKTNAELADSLDFPIPLLDEKVEIQRRLRAMPDGPTVLPEESHNIVAALRQINEARMMYSDGVGFTCARAAVLIEQLRAAHDGDIRMLHATQDHLIETRNALDDEVARLRTALEIVEVRIRREISGECILSEIHQSSQEIVDSIRATLAPVS